MGHGYFITGTVAQELDHVQGVDFIRHLVYSKEDDSFLIFHVEDSKVKNNSSIGNTVWVWLKDNSLGLLAVCAILGGSQLSHSNMMSRINERFDAQDKYIDQRFNAVDQRLDSIERRLENGETEMQGISRRVAYNEGMIVAFSHHNALVTNGDE